MNNIIHKEENELRFIMFLAGVGLCFLGYKSYSEWQYIIALLPLLMLLGYFYKIINYIIDDNSLYIKTGFLNYDEINISTIQVIEHNNYNKRINKGVIIDKEGIARMVIIKDIGKFTSSLLAINPKINIKKT